MKVLLTTEQGTVNITNYLETVRCSGDLMQAHRTLELGVLHSLTDTEMPMIDIPLGSLVQLYSGTTELHYGYVLERTPSTDGHTMPLTIKDRGDFIAGNKEMRSYTNTAPETIAAGLCREYGIPIGSLAKTGIPISRIFLSGSDTIYGIISTAYTLASHQNGKKYHIGFRGRKFFVHEKAPTQKTLVIAPRVNLIAATSTESIGDMVSQVAIYNAENQLVQTLENKEHRQQRGLRREILKQTKDNDRFAEGKTLLKEKGLKQKIVIDNLGDISCLTGGTIIVREPHTGLHGLFYIDSDLHEWKGGQYYNKLTVNFQAIMNEQELGSLPKEQ